MNMTLLGGKYKVTTDPYNFILDKWIRVDEKRQKSHSDREDLPSHKWHRVGYFGTMDFLLQSILVEETRDADARDLNELKSFLRDQKQLLFKDYNKWEYLGKGVLDPDREEK